MPSLNDKNRRLLILLPWLSVPLVLGSFLMLWDRVPERLAVHFDSSGAANRWMSRWQFIFVAVGILIFVLINFTWKLRAGRDTDNFNVRVLSYYVSTIILTCLLLVVLKFNL